MESTGLETRLNLWLLLLLLLLLLLFRELIKAIRFHSIPFDSIRFHSIPFDPIRQTKNQSPISNRSVAGPRRVTGRIQYDFHCRCTSMTNDAGRNLYGIQRQATPPSAGASEESHGYRLTR